MLQVQQAIAYHQEDNQEEDDGNLLELELYQNRDAVVENKLQLVPVEHSNSESEFSLFDRDSKFNILSITSHTTNNDGDPFSNLHPNWAHLNFKEKKNLMTHSISSVKVTMAINKLENLQNNIEKWVAKVENNESRQKDLSQLTQSSQRLLEYVKQSEFSKPKTEMKFIQDPSSDTNSNMGLVIKAVSNTPASVTEMRKSGILEDILMLFAKLEFERRRLETLLKNERESFAKLKKHIEDAAKQRAVLLPQAVQDEHDAYVADISELKFHILFNTKTETKLIRRIDIEKKVFERLDAEMKSISSTMPLIEEKICIEEELLEKVKKEQMEVDELLRKAQERQKNAEERNEQGINKARMDREEMEAELAECRRDLNKSKKRHQEAVDKSEENVQTIEHCKVKIIENTESEKKEILKKVATKKRIEALTEEIKVVKEKRVEVTQENEAEEYQNTEFKKKLDDKILKYNIETTKLKDIYDVKMEKLEKILKKNMEKDVDIEEMTRHKRQVDSKIEKEQRNKERIMDEQSRIEDELSATNATHSNAVKSSNTMANDQEKELKRLEQRESLLKKQIMDLRKQITEERNQAAVLLSKMKQETEDYESAQTQSIQKTNNFESKKIEMEKRISDLEIRVEESKIREVKLVAEVSTLSVELEKIVSEHNHMSNNRKEIIEELVPKHANCISVLNTNKERLAYIKYHSEDLNNKIEEMTNAIKVMHVKTTDINKETAMQTEKYQELLIELKEIAVLDEKTKEALKNQVARMEVSSKAHEEFIKGREEYCERIKKQLEDNCQANSELASRYRELKYGIYNVKVDILRNLDHRLNTMYNLKDKRQMKSLQLRTHTALKDFFAFKIKHSENKYEGLQDKKEGVAIKLTDLESKLGHSLTHVTNYLNNQVDMSKIRQKAMDKVRLEEAVEKQRIHDETNRLIKDCERLSAKKKRSQPLPPIAINMNTNAKAAATNAVNAV